MAHQQASRQPPTYGSGESVAITNGAFAGLAGLVVDRYEDGYRVAVGGLIAEVSATDLAPDLLTVLAEAEAELNDLQGDGVAVSQRLLSRIRAAIHQSANTAA